MELEEPLGRAGPARTETWIWYNMVWDNLHIYLLVYQLIHVPVTAQYSRAKAEIDSQTKDSFFVSIPRRL